MKAKKVIAISLTAVMMLGLLSGCKKEDSKDKETSVSGVMTIEIVAKGFQHDFWQAVLAGSKKAEEEFKVKTNFVGPEGEGAIATQVEQINNAINKKPAAICLAALDTNAALDAITQAQSQGIPIIGFDSGVPGAPEGAVKANAATDNYAAGELAAEKMYEAIKYKVTNPTNVVRFGVVSQEAN